MKLKSKLGIAFVTLAMAAGALVACNQPAPTKYKVTVPTSTEYTIAGIEEDGYVAGATVSFTVSVANPEDREINTVKYDTTALTADATGGYNFVMPEKDVALSVTLKDVKKYALTIEPGTLKVDSQVEAKLALGTDPVVSFTVNAKSGADHVQINDKVIKGISEGDVTLAAVVNQKEVATLNITVGKTDIKTIKAALDEALEEAPCNAKNGAAANMSSTKLIAGKVIAISSPYKEAVQVVIDDGTAAILLMVTKKDADPYPVAIGDTIKVEAVLTNYYGLFEGIAADSKTGGTANYLAADALIPFEKEFTPTLSAPVAMSADEFTAYYTASEANGKSSGDNRTWTPIKYVTITGKGKKVDTNTATSGHAFSITDTLLLDVDSTHESVEIVFEENKTSTFDAFLLGVNSSKKKSNAIVTAQRAKAPESVTVNATTKEILRNNSFELTYTVTPADAWGTLEWKSSDETVATVKAVENSNKAVVKATNKAGTSNITVTVGDKTATCALTVKPDEVPATAVELKKATLTIDFPGDGGKVEVKNTTPAAVTDVPTFTSSDETVATVDQEGNVKPLKVGSTTVTVKYNDSVSATCAVTVKALHGTTAEDPLKPAEAHAIGEKLGYGKTSDYTYYVKGAVSSFYGTNNKSPYLDGSKFEIQVSSWGDNDAKVVKGAIILAHGKLYSGGNNFTKFDGKTLEVDSVSNTAVGLVEITPADGKTEIKAGETLQLTAKAYPEALNATIDSWESADETVATVSNTGLVTAVEEGTVVIKAKSGTVVGEFELTVLDNKQYTSLVKYHFENTKSTTAVTSSDTIKGWFKVDSGEDKIKAFSSMSRVYPGANGGSGDTAWDSGNILKIGASSNGGTITIELKDGVSVDKIILKGFGWKNTLVVSAENEDGTITAACKAGALPLANKDNVDASFSKAGEITLKFSSAVSGKIVLKTNSTAVCITGLEFLVVAQAQA